VKLTNTRAVFYITALLLFLSGCSGQTKIFNCYMHFSPEAQDCVKVMTFNIRTGDAWWLDGWSRNNWHNRKNITIDTIAENAADIFGIQEGVDSQLGEIESALPQYSKYAIGRDDGKNKGETCAIFFRRDRFKLVDSGTFWFSGNPDKPGSKSWGNLFPRICSWVQLMDKTSRTDFYIYNVHLDNLSQHSREKSVRLLAAKIAGRKNTQDPFILIGDFNMEINNPAMQYLEQTNDRNACAAMVNVWQSIYPGKPKTGTYHKFRGSSACAKIDHISISRSAQALNAKIDTYEENGHYPSDHFPVIAMIRFPEKRAVSMNWQKTASK
jgi:endonuclease/exonuclease/phosphatase family metal-dependent hydrolase